MVTRLTLRSFKHKNAKSLLSVHKQRDSQKLKISVGKIVSSITFILLKLDYEYGNLKAYNHDNIGTERCIDVTESADMVVVADYQIIENQA